MCFFASYFHFNPSGIVNYESCLLSDSSSRFFFGKNTKARLKSKFAVPFTVETMIIMFTVFTELLQEAYYILNSWCHFNSILLHENYYIVEIGKWTSSEWANSGVNFGWFLKDWTFFLRSVKYLSTPMKQTTKRWISMHSEKWFRSTKLTN